MYPEWRRWSSVFILLLSYSFSSSLSHAGISVPIEGKGSVAENSGTFTYSIPIDVSPGRSGLAPQLALTYNSSGENGFLGVGWDLPIGYVMRSTENGVDYNCFSSATNSCFVFMLGGASSELIPRTDWCSDCYGAKIEGGFIQFRFISNTYWQAIDKSGTKYLFGQTPASRQDNPNDVFQVFKWELDAVTDTHNNTVTYAYFKDQGETYIETIDYQANHIIFNRDNTRTDKPKLFGPNFAVTTAYRLSGIDIYSNWNGATGTRSRKYVFGYCGTTGVSCAASATGRSVLGKVTQYGSDGVTALPAVILDSQNVAANWTLANWTSLSLRAPIDDRCFSGDLNGDGKSDVWCGLSSGVGNWEVRLSTGTGWTPVTRNGPAPSFPVSNRCLTGDLNADGKIDFWCKAASGGSWDVGLSTGSGWTRVTWAGSSPSIPITEQCLAGDLNNDGKSDFWCQTGSGTGTWDVRLSTGSGWTAASWSGPGPALPVGKQCLTGDLNGDRKTDFWCETGSGSASWHVAISTGTDWSTSFWSGSAPGLPVGDQCLTGDLNGDGKTDFWCQTGNGSGQWDVRLSTGTGWTAEGTWAGPSPGLPLGKQCLSGDLNGDGNTDFWCKSPTGANWDVRLSSGSGWTAASQTGLSVVNLAGIWQAMPSMPMQRKNLSIGVVNDILYAVGGSPGDGVEIATATVQAYDPATNIWTTKASMPTERAGLAVGVINGILYAVGGYDILGTSLATVEAYDPATNTWTAKASMPTARSDLSVGVINGILYAVGGTTGNGIYGATAIVEAYDPVANTWTTKAPIPSAYPSLSAGVIDGILYVVGGALCQTLEAYDPATNMWMTKAPVPVSRCQIAVGVANGILYGVGGTDGALPLEAYDPATNTWTRKADSTMPTTRVRLAVGAVKDTLYAVGGGNSSVGTLATVEAFTPLNISDQCLQGDLNGDGKTDFWCYGGNWRVTMMNPGLSDLLTGISNGIGGKTTVAYQPSSAFWSSSDTGWNLPFIKQNVSSVTLCDKYIGSSCTGNAMTTNYTYSGGYYNQSDHEFRGFSYVKVTNVAANNTTETWFHQGNGTSVAADSGSDSPGYTNGLPYRSVVKDSAGVVRSQTDTLYASDANGAAPFFTPAQQEDNWFCDAPSICKQTRSILTFDHANGNLIREDEYGDLSVTTDDRTVTKSYSPNTTAWILGLPTSETVYQGIGTTTQVARTDFYYDGVTGCNTPSTNQTPTKGNLTRTVRWLSGGTSPETRMAYDTYGNVICTRDPNGNITTVSYDTSSTFPKIVTNAAGHQATTQYYGVDGVQANTGLYGQVKSVTDLNGVVTTTTYDTFGRTSQVTLPNGLVNTFNYPCSTSTGCTPDPTNVFGNIGAQYVKESGGGLSSWTYFDGLGRTIAEETTRAGATIIRVETDYNNLGQLFHKTIPSFFGGPSNGTVTYAYDVIGRVSQITNPDASRTLFCYSLWSTGTIDAGNHMEWGIKDAYGRLIQVNEYTGTFTTCPPGPPGGAYAVTAYQYDVLSNLLKVTDAKGNQTTMRYDTLGRKIAMSDPDMGRCGDLTALTPASSFPWYPAPCWNYRYDAAGNMLQQIDAKSQTITFTYDVLNRVKTKTMPASGNPILTVAKTGSGAGSVTSSPAGINCGATCSTGFISGTSVTLTASASSGSTFAGFSGGCTSATTTCTFTITTNTGVTATFNDAQAPTAPSSLAAGVVGSTQINLTWTASTDNVAVTEYRVERCQGASCTNFAQIATPAATSFNNTGLTAATTYRYRVRAADAAGNLSSYSNIVSATTTAGDTTPPTISNIVSGSITSSGATITWTTNEASDTQVEYGTTTSYGSSTTLNTAMVTSHSTALSGLSASTLYHYRVKSRDEAGNLATSGDFTFTTSPSGGPDLTMLTVGATVASSNLTINDVVRNIGTVNAGAFNIGFYLSVDNTFQGTDTFLCQRSLSGLAAATSNPTSGTATTTCSIASVTPGLYYVIGRADSGSSITETNEANNNYPSSQVAIGPDLIVSLIGASKSSNTLTINNAVKNQGNVSAGTSEISFYLSTDQTLSTATDTFVCKRSVTSLAAGVSDPASGTTITTCTIPAVPAGSYYVLGFADSAGMVTESRENNNTATGANITVP